MFETAVNLKIDIVINIPIRIYNKFKLSDTVENKEMMNKNLINNPNK